MKSKIIQPYYLIPPENEVIRLEFLGDGWLLRLFCLIKLGKNKVSLIVFHCVTKIHILSLRPLRILCVLCGKI